MVQIDISTMTDGVHEVVLRPTPEDLELNPDEFADIRSDVRLDVGDHQILVELTVHARATVVCDRTLVAFEQPISGEFTIVFTKRAREATVDDDTVRRLDPNTRELDVTSELRDTLLLSIPLRNVAPEALEAELVLNYGAEEPEASIDPRWEALRGLSEQAEPRRPARRRASGGE